MKSLDKIKEILESHESKIKKEYQVKELGIFGSYIHNQQNDFSDVDILVEFYKTPGFFKYIELENYLSEILGIKVDLVLKNALKPNIGKRILDEFMYI